MKNLVELLPRGFLSTRLIKTLLCTCLPATHLMPEAKKLAIRSTAGLACPRVEGALAQLVRALPCHGRGCGFEPRRLRVSALSFWGANPFLGIPMGPTVVGKVVALLLLYRKRMGPL